MPESQTGKSVLKGNYEEAQGIFSFLSVSKFHFLLKTYSSVQDKQLNE